MANILAFSGSTREGSFNKKILKAAVKGARDAGASVTVIDLADFALPLYDGDLEAREGLPAKAIERLGYQLANSLDEARLVFRGYSTEFYFTS